MFKAVRTQGLEMVDTIEARELILHRNIKLQEEICNNAHKR